MELNERVAVLERGLADHIENGGERAEALLAEIKKVSAEIHKMSAALQNAGLLDPETAANVRDGAAVFAMVRGALSSALKKVFAAAFVVAIIAAAAAFGIKIQVPK